MATTFGYMSAWFKGAFKSIEDEFEIADGIIASGKIKVKSEQRDELVAYLNDPANMTQYGIELDFALFYDNSKTVKLTGKFTTPYKKEGNDDANTTTTRAKRQM
jgi:hypothetical protein